MPGVVHEVIVSLFEARQTLAAELLPVAEGRPPPAYDAIEQGSADFSQAMPVEYRGDGLWVLKQSGVPQRAIVLEVQLRRDESKRWSWPSYGVLARAKHRCEAVVLVVTLDAATERWASQPIPLGGANVFTPTVLGPSNCPPLIDPEIAQRNPELAVLSACLHGSGSLAPEVTRAAAHRVQRSD